MSITLSTPFVVTVGGSQVEDDADGALTFLSMDLLGYNLVLTFKQGNTSGSSGFVVGTYAPTIAAWININTGAWRTSTGLSGTLDSTPFTELQTAAINLRNAFETFAVNQSILPGTQVAWSAA